MKYSSSRLFSWVGFCVLTVFSAMSTHAGTLVIATVDNGHMLRLQDLSSFFEKEHPDIHLRWAVFKESVLRQAVRADINTQGGQFDVITIGTFEAPIWASRGWIVPIRTGSDYDVDDLLPNVRESLSYDGVLYGAPIYGESSMLMYRKDLMRKAGLEMPRNPTWTQVAAFAAKLHDPANGVYGICLRGSPGWGENMTLVTTIVNAFGGQWFDMDQRPRLDSQAWSRAVGLYVDLLKAYGPPGAVSMGYNEILALFRTGKCAQWVDATVAAGFLADPESSAVANEVGFAAAPSEVTTKGSHWLWAWALAIPRGTDPVRETDAQKFITWATSREYIRLVAARNGWSAVPTGARRSTYANPDFQRVAPWAKYELEGILRADPTDATLSPSPYSGIQFVTIPPFRAIGDEVGKLIRQAVTGHLSVKEALARGQYFAQRQMLLNGYPKWK
ncbi:sugar ABC transporter substrate-binding protein [Azoarcus sp. L1K30]|uniref:ABC transporter substrate-binding protein n=1 Tax=Azoarcus sp. L1K30 TaxID=2820277 RepID=UPI001B830CDF|nr:sugar ABC transporter substrate-binding protein [Azoarcus sp. L1K30]MBR0564791.1 sugar ABC transporter substrate-binding protein [Azoarcus sp. L1K30]